MPALQAASFVQQVILSYQGQASPPRRFELNITAESIQFYADGEILLRVIQKLFDLIFAETDDSNHLMVSVDMTRDMVCFTLFNPTYVPRSQFMELLYMPVDWEETAGSSLPQLVRQRLNGEISVVANAFLGTAVMLEVPKMGL